MLNIYFLPAYSPFLNAIEEFFGLLKFNFKKIFIRENLTINAAIV